MIRFILFRLAGGLLTLFLASVLVFASTEVLPGDAAQTALGKDATPLELKVLRHEMGLDQSAQARYVRWLSHAVRLDFGRSLAQGVGIYMHGGKPQLLGVKVSSLVSAPLRRSAILILCTMAILVPISLLVGITTALRRQSPYDKTAQIVMLVFTAFPEFVLGAALALVFGVAWPVLPPVSLVVSAQSLVLPIATLVLVAIASTARFIRAGVNETMAAEFVIMARLKGISERRVVIRHILPNSLGPTLQAFALAVGWLAGGIVIVEYLFGYPGMGSGLIQAIGSRDVPTIQAYTLVIALIYIVANMIADFLTVVMNPRLRAS